MLAGKSTSADNKNKSNFFSYVKEQVEPVKLAIPRRRTIVPDNIVKGSALFRDKFNQHTKDTLSKKGDNDEKGGFWNKVAGVAMGAAEIAAGAAEAWVQTKIGSSIQGLKDTYAQKLIRAANSDLTRMRNDLVKNLKNKIKNENVGKPVPKNIYTQSTITNDIDLVLHGASRLTGVNFSDMRTSAEIKNINPSLKNNPLNIV
jgi:hypothetical protein